MRFEYEGVSFKLVDVGGQVMERKKWPKVYENVTHLLFVASLADFAEVMIEDGVTNRLLDAMQLFDSVVNSNDFVDKEVILFLNKEDVLMKKIEQKDLGQVFKEYNGGKDYNKAIEFLKQKFISLVKNSSRLTIIFIQAVNLENVSIHFNELKKLIVSKLKK